VRTTLTLDDDVAAKVKLESRRTGRSFKQVVNEALRRGLAERRTTRAQAFTIRPRDLGNLRPGLQLDSIAELLEQVEGPVHR
jgi:hypothetical protein